MAPIRSSEPIRLLLVDDHRILREGLRLRLSQEPDFQVVGETADGRETLDLLPRLAPDVVILDMGLPDTDGLDLARKVLELCPSTRVLVLSGTGDGELLERTLQAGISGYVLKANATEELTKAIRSVAAGRMYVCPELSSVMLTRFKRLLEGDNREECALSEREVEVVRLFAEGRNTKEIAAQLGLSVKTIETHRVRIMEKLNLRSIAELTKYAIRRGLTPL
ncbi:MAG: response regulator transcription factor [Verrucomicrobiota bacterium]